MIAEMAAATKREETFFNLLKQNPLIAISSQSDATIATTNQDPNIDPDISEADSIAVFGTKICDRTFALANFASGSIWTSIIMHTIINSFGYVVMIAELATASAGINLEETAELQRTQTSSFLTTGLVLFVISIGCAFLIKIVLKKIAVSENNQEAMGVFGVK
jgi:hypothetical protein